MAAYERMFSGLSRREFVQKYFNRQVLYRPRSVDNVAALIDETSFFERLQNCENVRAVFRGLRQASIAPDDAKAMYEAGATICATGIDLADPGLRKLAEGVRADLGYTGLVTVNAYLSPARTGFAHHFDPRVVTAIQISGTKTWRYCATPYEKWPGRESAYAPPGRDALLRHVRRNGSAGASLSPGDLLCLPAGCIHWAMASEPSLALNLAFDYIDYGIADCVADAARSHLLAQPELRGATFLQNDTTQRPRINAAADVLEEVAARLRSGRLKLAWRADEC